MLSFALVYGLFYNTIGWRGMLWIGVAPALALVYIRFFVKEPEVWVENQRNQRAQNREVKVPLLSIFKPGMLAQYLELRAGSMAAGFVTVLFDQRAVRDPSAGRSEDEPGVDRDADRVRRQSRRVSRQLGLGLGGG